MRNFFLAVLLIGSASVCCAGTLWYNGDYDNRNGFCSAQGSGYDCQSYDDFVVPSGGWTINSIYTTSFINAGFTTPTSAGWEIRSGISEGDGGTVIASGTTTDLTWTYQTGVSYGSSYLFRVNGLSQPLGAGTYWVTIYPIADSGWGYIGTTSGANAIGLPAGNNGETYITFPPNNYNFTAWSTVKGGGTWDLAIGIDGTAGTSGVPEPASAALLGGALLLLGLFRRRNA